MSTEHHKRLSFGVPEGHGEGNASTEGSRIDTIGYTVTDPIDRSASPETEMMLTASSAKRSSRSDEESQDNGGPVAKQAKLTSPTNKADSTDLHDQDCVEDFFTAV